MLTERELKQAETRREGGEDLLPLAKHPPTTHDLLLLLLLLLPTYTPPPSLHAAAHTYPRTYLNGVCKATRDTRLFLIVDTVL